MYHNEKLQAAEFLLCSTATDSNLTLTKKKRTIMFQPLRKTNQRKPQWENTILKAQPESQM